jgi:lipopolysaccharide transport system ATP-binding protein
MSSEELMVSVEELGKKYDIYAQPSDRLKQMVLPRLGNLVGKRGLTYHKEFWALKDVSFSVRRGETVGVIGRNGSGKSTLLQMICGTLHPTEGAVRTHGRIAALLELGAGFNPEFTGEENVYLSGLLYGIPESVLRKRLDSILAFADIGDFIQQPVKTYSSGMYVRLAFSIAAHVDADMLIIDEALSVGDVRFTQKCMRFLREFQKNGTLLFVSHDTMAVTNLCDRAVWLDRGRLVMDGVTRDVVESYLAEQHVADRSALGQQVAVRSASANRVDTGDTRQQRADAETLVPVDIVDTRHAKFTNDGLNRLRIFNFDPEKAGAEFGAGNARISHARLVDQRGDDCLMITGGEVVSLIIEAEANASVDAPIFGFYVKDRLGQRLFGDNSYLFYEAEPLHFAANERMQATFKFRMPVLPTGDYSIDVALASGSQDDHTQQHWIHDALSFQASESSMRHGLVGIPMHSVVLQQVRA